MTPTPTLPHEAGEVARGRKGHLSAIIDIIVPVFGTVAVGWALGRWLLTADGLRG